MRTAALEGRCGVAVAAGPVGEHVGGGRVARSPAACVSALRRPAALAAATTAVAAVATASDDAPEAAAAAAAEACRSSGRRRVVVAAPALLLLQFAGAAEAAPQLEEYLDEVNGFSCGRPAGWERTEKSGATVLWTDPQRKSSTLGVVVNPSKIESLEQFGTLEEVSKRLQDAERDKDGFFGLEILAESQRRASGGALVYDVAYALDSFRGKKTILTSVCITRRRLFIWTFTIKEAKEEGEEAAYVQRTKDVAFAAIKTFDVKAAGSGAA